MCDTEYEEVVETYSEDLADEHRFQVSEGCDWWDVRETPANVRTGLQSATCCIQAANQKHFYGVYGDAQWRNKDRLQDALRKDRPLRRSFVFNRKTDPLHMLTG